MLQAIKNNPWIRRFAWLVLCWGGAWLLGWLVVPPLAQSQIERHASEALGRKLTVERVEFLPWTLEATLHGVALASKDGSSEQVRVGRIYIDAELQSLWRGAPVIDALQVDDPVVRVTQLAPGVYDVDDLLALMAAKPQGEKSAAEPAHFALFNIALKGGVVEFDDRTVEVVHTLRRVELDVPFLSSFSADREVKVTPRLAFELNGSTFDTSAMATPFTDTREAEVRLHIENFDLAPFGRYLPPSVPVRLKAGRLDADVQLGFEQRETPRLLISGDVQLSGVHATDAQEQPLLQFEEMRAVFKETEPLRRRINIDLLEWRGARAHVRRNEAGEVNLAGLPRAERDEHPAPQTKESAEPWRVYIARVGLRDGFIQWTDASLPRGTAAWEVEDLQVEASSIALPLEQPMQLRASASLRQSAAAGSSESARLAVLGQVSASQAQAALSIKGLPLSIAAPYLAGVLQPRVEGSVDADLGIARHGDVVLAKVAALSVDKLALRCASKEQCVPLQSAGIKDAPADSLAAWSRLEAGNAWIRWPQRAVSVERISLQRPRLLLSRTRTGEWMFEQWGVSHPGVTGPNADAPKAAGLPWSMGLASLEIDGAAVALRDAVAQSAVALNVFDLQLHARDFAYADGRVTPTALRLEGRVGAGRTEPGRLRYEGSVAMAPVLTAQGKVHAQHLPLHALEPYVGQQLNVDILRADGGFDGDVRYVQGNAGATVSVKGDVSLDEVRVRAKAGLDMPEETKAGERSVGARGVGARGEDLLRWKSLALRGVAMNLQPDQPVSLDVKETALSDFFARIIVQEDGRINLQDIRKASAAEDAVAASNAAAVAPAAAPSAPQIRFGPVALTNGSVRFTDYFIKPNYSADLSALTGRLSAFSSVSPEAGAAPQMADLELRGRAQGTASLEVTGRINPLVKPLALDIQGRMRDLELPPLSPYSIKYAGHGIEKGKLSMDVAYKILPDGQLIATNKLVLNQLAFGEPVEGASASLPVRLATALLADRNGIIDVDLPISGSLNDPEFRLGAVILKVIGNLIMKAITAPFSLLAGAFSDAGEQGAVLFALGSAELDEKARQQLDKIANELNNRPALKVTVVGWAQPDAEQLAWKRQRLRDMAEAQKRRAAIRAGEPADSIAPLTEEEYPALLKELYRRSDIRKPRNFVGLAKDVPVAEMEALLMHNLTVPDNAMADLALARGVAVRDYLAQQQVPLERLFVGASKLQPGGEGDAPWRPKAELSLNAQ